jgi:hypothetical protein
MKHAGNRWKKFVPKKQLSGHSRPVIYSPVAISCSVSGTQFGTGEGRCAFVVGRFHMEEQMRKTLIAAATLAALIAAPGLASADDNAVGGAAAGAVTGGVAGAIVGGPVGAVVGGTVGGTMGAAAGSSPREERVIIEERSPSVSQRSCIQDSAGNRVCEEIRR